MESNESPRAHKRRAVVGLFCCCCLPSNTLGPDSRVVRITAGVIAIIAMLLSGMGFSALQRDTVNPYEHLFITGSSSRHMPPAAWGSASAPAPAPFLQPVLRPSGGSVSAEGARQGSPEESPVRDQTGPSPAGYLSNAAMAPSPMQSVDPDNRSSPFAINSATGPAQDAASQAPQGVASVESGAPNFSSLGSPESSPAWLGAASGDSITGARCEVRLCSQSYRAVLFQSCSLTLCANASQGLLDNFNTQ